MPTNPYGSCKATLPRTDDEETSDSKARQARAARGRRERQRGRKMAHGLLSNEMKVLEVQEALTRAERTQADRANKQHRIGAHVAAMVRQLLHWEGRGEANGGWIHKSAVDWEQTDAALTQSKLRTARRVAREEGLWEEKQELRPGDRRPTVYYRLDMLRLAQVVVESELENTHRLLGRERRRNERNKLNAKRCKLERARNDLRLIGMEDSGDRTHTPPLSISQGSPVKLTALQGTTPGDFVLQTTLPEGLEALPASQDNAPSAPSASTHALDTLEEREDAERLRGGMDASGVGEDAPGVGGEQLGRLMRGEGGKSGEDVLGPMVARYFAGGESLERLARTACGFVAREESLAYVMGAVEVHLAEIAVEEGER